MLELEKLPLNFSAHPQHATTWFGLKYDPDWDTNLDSPQNIWAKSEVAQLSRTRNTKNRSYIGLSLDSSKVKDLNEYIGWINQIYYKNKKTYFYISTDSTELLFSLVNILKWSNPPNWGIDFFVEKNQYNPLDPQMRWVADVNLLSRSDYIISTPHNFKAHLAREISGAPIMAEVPANIYVTNLDGQKVL